MSPPTSPRRGHPAPMLGLLIASILSLAVASPAPAEEHAPDYVRPGPYVGLFAGLQIAQSLDDEIDKQLPPLFSGPNLTPSSKTRADPSLSIGLRAGYRLNPYLAGELSYQLESGFPAIATVTVRDADPDPTQVGEPAVTTDSAERLHVKVWTLTANVRAFLPIGRVHPFLSVGAGALSGQYSKTANVAFQNGKTLTGRIKGDDVVFASRFGGGVEFYLSDHVLVGLEASYVLPTGNLDFLDFVSGDLGLQYRF